MTKTKTKREYLKDPTYAIFSESTGFKDMTFWAVNRSTFRWSTRPGQTRTTNTDGRRLGGGSQSDDDYGWNLTADRTPIICHHIRTPIHQRGIIFCITLQNWPLSLSLCEALMRGEKQIDTNLEAWQVLGLFTCNVCKHIFGDSQKPHISN